METYVNQREFDTTVATLKGNDEQLIQQSNETNIQLALMRLDNKSQNESIGKMEKKIEEIGETVIGLKMLERDFKNLSAQVSEMNGSLSSQIACLQKDILKEIETSNNNKKELIKAVDEKFTKSEKGIYGELKTIEERRLKDHYITPTEEAKKLKYNIIGGTIMLFLGAILSQLLPMLFK